MQARRDGKRQLGRYDLLCELGRGGMAELQLARLHGIGGFSRLFAVKLILPHLTHEPTFVEQFLNEGRIAARLSHPNVCQVFELGEADGQLFLAMEYLEGAAWERLAPELPDDPARALRLTVGAIAQACDGLHHAHEVPIIHRDVSPSNLFVTVDGVCKVLDFGVSKLLTEGKHTRTGVLKGKLPYMSPEQIEGTELDARADVWSAGVVVWEALARRRLFDRSTDFQIWKAITEEEVPPLDGHGPEVQRVVARALARNRDDRYASMRTFADELRALVTPASQAELADFVRDRCRDELVARTELVQRTTAVGPLAAAADEEPSATVSMALRGDSLVIARPRRSRWPLVIGVLALAAIATVIVLVTREREDARLAPVVAAVAPPAAAPADAPPVDAAPAPVAAPPPDKPQPRAPIAKVAKKSEKLEKAEPVAQKPEPPPPGAPQEPGFVTIASQPFARVYIDGAYIDQTPVFRRRLAAGKHVVRAVLEDGRERSIPIDLAPGREVNLGKLAW